MTMCFVEVARHPVSPSTTAPDGPPVWSAVETSARSNGCWQPVNT
ncbi:hypothetical protein [Micromonospora rhizosphaerae]|nr:hypothetical protein [Micromonospora rhizosphaerae]